MKSLIIKQTVVILILALASLSAMSQEFVTASPKIENQLKGELDYANGGLEFTLRQHNGEHIRGSIDTEGVIHFNLLEFDIKALYNEINLGNYNFQSLFDMQRCEDKDLFGETPFDEVFSQKYESISIEKYGIRVGTLSPVSDKKVLGNNQYSSDSLTVGSKYHWFYVDRSIDYTEECSKTSFHGIYDIEVIVSADVQLNKGWNFIKESLVEIQDYSKNDYHTKIPKRIHFTTVSPEAKEVKWFIKQTKKDEDIQVAKVLYNYVTITQEQFEKWAPDELGDLSVTSKEYGNPPRGRKNKNNIHLIYADEAQEKEIDLYVVDYSKNPGDIEMIDFAYAMEYEGKEEKDIKPYIAQYREAENTTQLLYKVGDRVFVEASGKNINAEDLWGYIEKLNVEKLP